MRITREFKEEIFNGLKELSHKKGLSIFFKYDGLWKSGCRIHLKEDKELFIDGVSIINLKVMFHVSKTDKLHKKVRLLDFDRILHYFNVDKENNYNGNDLNQK